MTLRHLDLFSGIGGFALAAAWAGFTTVGFAEVDPFCSKVLKKHWPHVPNFGDVRTVPNLSKINLITGGFPCQPFSQAGKKKGRQDDRYLWPEFLRIIRANKPNWVVGENVAGIIHMELDNILDDLENEGYETRAFIIPASAVNAPHRRERVWIVAHALRQRCNVRFDSASARRIQDDWERGIKALQEDWTGFQPNSWKTFNFQDWFGFTTDPNRERLDPQSTDSFTGHSHSEPSNQTNQNRETECKETWENNRGQYWRQKSIFNWQENQPPIPGVDDGLPNIVDRNKSLGNAIVPQVVYPILRLIALMNGAYTNE